MVGIESHEWDMIVPEGAKMGSTKEVNLGRRSKRGTESPKLNLQRRRSFGRDQKTLDIISGTLYGTRGIRIKLVE